jgi:hypothetical protein
MRPSEGVEAWANAKRFELGCALATFAAPPPGLRDRMVFSSSMENAFASSLRRRAALLAASRERHSN